MGKINKLTAEQASSLVTCREKWLKIGLSTQPINRYAAKSAVCAAYISAGLPPPSKFVFKDNPHAGAIAAAKISGDENINDQLYKAIRGSHDAGWLSFYDFFMDLGMCEKVSGLIDVAKNCGWVWVFNDVAIITERPSAIRFDPDHRLHCEDGPAIKYKGFSVYAWHGQRIPGDWIKNKNNLTAETALTWENIEQRRAAAEILGWDVILQKLNAVTINKDVDPEIGELLEATIPDIGQERFLRVQCGTKRQFAIPVPPEMTTALEAQAWMVGLSTDDFNLPEIRT